MVRNREFVALLMIVVVAALSRQVAAAQYDPPANYYSTATGTGATLKTQLRTIISDMNSVSYDNARFSAPYTDPDPNVPGNILLIYNRASVSGVWDTSPLIWNREHIWPQSRLGTASDSDQFNLRPADPTINSNRGNDAFGLDTTTGNHGSVGADYYYPGDADAGDAARSLFYMATRYSNLSLTDATLPSTGGTAMGDLSSLLVYHYRDVPDDFERRRNHAIYGLAGDGAPAITNPYRQENRNPYVDHPEYVWSVFVDQQNDSQLYVGAVPNADGSSVENVNLGTVIVGATVPSPQNITLTKDGLDATYYEVTTAGLATSSVTGRLNAFPIIASGTSTKVLSVGLNTNTTTPGSRQGTVSINNLDITTAGGTGHGANDGNDTINVSLDVLAHANPSFSLASDENTLSYDFGTVTQGSIVPQLEFDIANLINTPGFTAELELDSIASSGDDEQFLWNLSPFTGDDALAAGSAEQFFATIITSAEGTFSASYTLNFSDENLPGATSLGSLTLNLTGTVEAAAETADFDGDGDVDGRDFLIWQRGGSSNSLSPSDLAGWQESYGTEPLLEMSTAAAAAFSSTGASPVPEPGTLILVPLGVIWCGFHRYPAFSL